MKPSWWENQPGAPELAPPGERDRVDVDEPEERHARRRSRGSSPPSRRSVAPRQREAAAEEVAGDREQVLAHPEHDAAVGRGAAEPVLGQEPVDDDDGAVGEREPVDRGSGGSGATARSRRTSDEPEREQRLLPGGDDLERGAAEPGG